MSQYVKNRYGSIVQTDKNGNNFTITKKEQSMIKTLVKRANSKRSYYNDKYYNEVKNNNNMKGVSKEVYSNLLSRKGFITEKYSSSFNQFNSKEDVKDFIKELKQVTKKGYTSGGNKAKEIRESMKNQLERMYGNDGNRAYSVIKSINDADLMSIYIHNDNIIREVYYPEDSVDQFIDKMESDLFMALKQIRRK